MQIVELCCQDAVALRAQYDSELHVFTRIEEITDERLVPFGARDGSGAVTKRALTRWWQGRAIPVTRDGYDSLKDDLDGLDPLDLLDGSMGLSLSDQFWMRDATNPSSWEEVNFFDNGFDTTLGLITLGSFGSVADRGQLNSRNPNSSLGGNLRKAWELRDGKPVLVKAGSAPFDQEPINELIATKLYERLLDPGDFVPYTLEERERRLYSVCPDMVGRDECLIPAWDIINSAKQPGHLSPWMHLKECYAKLGIEDAEQQLTKMFVCDYIIANRDRHWNNFGVIFDAHTMDALRVAPIYDSGSSLWSDAYELERPIAYLYRPLPLLRQRQRRIHPKDQLAIMQDFSWLDVDALDGFPDEAAAILSASGRLPPERIEAIIKELERNIQTVQHTQTVQYIQTVQQLAKKEL